MLGTIGESKDYKHAPKEIMPGSRMLNVSEELTEEEVIYQPFPGYSNPDRWAVLSTYETKDGGAFVKIHGMFPHRQMAENVGKTAMAQGYRSNCVVADTRSWLKFPVEEVESEIHVNESLKRAVGIEIKKDRNELERLRARVKSSRDDNPTSAYGRYLQLVSSSAREIIDRLGKGEEKELDMRKKFEEFRAAEIAKIHHAPLDPLLQKHFKQKIRDASLQDKEAAKEVQRVGMGMPSF